jgi:hypothetical protein
MITILDGISYLFIKYDSVIITIIGDRDRQLHLGVEVDIYFIGVAVELRK